MGMRVDEPRRDAFALHVNHAVGQPRVNRPDGRDAAAFNQQIRLVAFFSRPVNDGSIF